MILVLICSLILFIIVKLDRSIPRSVVVVAYFLHALLLTLWGIEYSMNHVALFTSDEITYISAANKFPIFDDRFLWYFLNYYMMNFDFSLWGLSLKLINLPLMTGLLILIGKIFDIKRMAVAMIILPYIVYMATFNLRDIAILFFTAFAVYAFFKNEQNILLSWVGLLMLYMLRPFVAIFLICLFLLYTLRQYCLTLFKVRLTVVHVIAIILIPILLFGMFGAFYGIISAKVSSYYAWFQYTTGEGEAAHIAQVSAGVTTGNRMVDFAISLVRYVFTPLPHSIFLRLMSGGSEVWGVIDDLARAMNQCGYYILLMYVGLHIRSLFVVVRKMTIMQYVMLINLLIYWPIYSFHLYGATHQRLKIPFQIVIFIFAVLIYQYQKEKGNVNPLEAR